VSDIERELKLTPADPALLEDVARLERFGEFVVTGRRRELQHNSFFDTRSAALKAARVGFRRRTIDGQRLARWTLKAPGDRATVRGVATRTELELHLDPDMPPALALAALRSAARQRDAVVLAEALDDALVANGLPLAQPFLESWSPRPAAGRSSWPSTASISSGTTTVSWKSKPSSNTETSGRWRRFAKRSKPWARCANPRARS
jgi:hypothetical protein